MTRQPRLALEMVFELGTIAGRLLFPLPVLRVATQRRLLRLGLIPAQAVFAGAAARMAYAASSVAVLAHTISLIVSFWLPEPQQAELPD
jgi:hypothetical protein